MITTDQHHHDHHQYNHNHHDHDDDDDQEHPARAGQREDGEQEVQQPEPDHVEPFCPGGFFVAIFITNIVCVIDVYVIYAALLIVSLPQNLDQTILDLIAHQNSGVWCFSVVQLVALVYKVT